MESIFSKKSTRFDSFGLIQFISFFVGLIYVQNPFTVMGQRYWTVHCLKEFPRKPNKRNVDIDNDLSEIDDLWEFSQT